MDKHYTIVLRKSVQKFLEKHRELIPKFLVATQKISVDPFDQTLDIKPLRWTDKRRLRIGSYRFIYQIIQDKLIIYVIEWWTRWDIYKGS